MAAACSAGLLLSGAVRAEDAEEFGNAHGQATYVWQDKAAFPALYTGPNSLTPQRERGYSFSATLFLGLRPWRGGELYLDPELVQGVPMSRLQGLGGLTNGENQKTAGPNPKPFVARAFLRQTWALGGGTEAVGSDQNQLAGRIAKRRIVLTAGKLAVIDLFDRNDMAADPRTRFLNWSFLTHGSFDYAADARGYSNGAALEWYHDDWVLRAGRFMVPEQPNGLPLDFALARRHGDQVEVEHRHELAGRPGKLRVMAFRNRARMSRYGDALAAAAGGTPDLNAVRTRLETKRGLGVALEQELGPALGAFARVDRADGRTETSSFTEIDDSVSGGVLLQGARWGRAEDTLGLAFASNGLSRLHRQYLAAGGLGFFIGDGRLNYRRETIGEAYYSIAALKHASLTLGWQHIVHPAYNADRGPVNVGSVRLHLEF